MGSGNGRGGSEAEEICEQRYDQRAGRRWNLDGYICLSISLLWGALGFLCVKWGNLLLVKVYRIMPGLVREIFVWVLLAALFVDALATYMLITGKSGRLDRWETADNQFENVAARLGKWISGQVERRIHNAYQVVEQLELEEVFGTFAEGCGFYKIVWLFFVGAFLGERYYTLIRVQSSTFTG